MTLRQSVTFHDHYTTEGLKKSEFSFLKVQTCELEKLSNTNKKVQKKLVRQRKEKGEGKLVIAQKEQSPLYRSLL